MDFSIKAEEKISSIIADEIIKRLEKEEVKGLVSLENNIHSVQKETGSQVYQKVLEEADQAHGKAISCTCGR